MRHVMEFIGRFFRILWAILRQLALWLWAALRALWTLIRRVVPPAWRALKRFTRWVMVSQVRRRVALVLMLLLGGYLAYRIVRLVQIIRDPRNDTFTLWFTGSSQQRTSLITSRRTPCPGAPFLLPSEGYIGLLYGDPRPPYSETHLHQGIDIFSPGEAGQTPVYAAYDGYITRLDGWTSSMIERIPDDPLVPGRQIWLYYTHMASRDGQTQYIADAFPQGIREVFVTQGTLLGYAGNYSGAGAPVAVHLHFSIVRDDGYGNFTNELYFDNTIDPSRYLGMALNYGCASDVPLCTEQPVCPNAVLGAGGD